MATSKKTTPIKTTKPAGKHFDLDTLSAEQDISGKVIAETTSYETTPEGMRLAKELDIPVLKMDLVTTHVETKVIVTINTHEAQQLFKRLSEPTTDTGRTNVMIPVPCSTPISLWFTRVNGEWVSEQDILIHG